VTRQELEDLVLSLRKRVETLEKTYREKIPMRDPQETNKTAMLSLDLSDRTTPVVRIEVE
jgi:hypothetical protein